MNERLISKRTFLSGATCLTQGWLQHHAPPDDATPEAEWGWYNGNTVQAIARVQLGEGVQLLGGSSQKAPVLTAQAMANPANSLLFEATFVGAGCIARADALRRTDTGWDLIEIKAATVGDDDKIKQEHLDDLAYTAFVMGAAGVTPERSILMLVDKSYRHGTTQPLLREVDASDQIRGLVEEFASRAQEVTAACQTETPPEARLIPECKDCVFFANDCLGVGVEDSIFHLPRLLRAHFDALRPHTRLSQIPVGIKLAPTQLRFLETWRSGRPSVDTSALAALDSLQYPIHYLDFESVNPAVPWFNGDAPYRVLLFQYSIHTRTSPGADTEHRYFLAETGEDWRRKLAESLLDNLGSSGSIVVYAHYEKTQLKELANLFPDLKDRIEGVIGRLFDLEKMILNGYQHPGFMGRSSIKNVLPVMVPELSYSDLTVGGGLTASAVFALMQVGKYRPDEFEKHREHLLEYCALDTMAMVRVHEELEKIRSNR